MSSAASAIVTSFLSDGSLSLSRSVSRIQAMLNSSNYHAADLATLMQTDPTLTAAVMSVANSTFFSRSPCAGISEAVNRLGSAQLSRIFAQVLARSSMMAPLNGYGLAADGIWRRAVYAAVGAEMTAARQLEDRSTAYMAGLLHQIGMLVTNGQWKKQCRPEKLKLADFEHEYSAEERARYQFDQAAFGSELLRQLSFPETIYRVVGRQYAAPASPLASALYLGRLARAISCDNLTPLPNQEVLEVLGLSANREFAKFLADIRTEAENRIQGH